MCASITPAHIIEPQHKYMNNSSCGHKVGSVEEFGIVQLSNVL